MLRAYEDANAEVRLDYWYTDEGQRDIVKRYSDLAGTSLVAVSDYDYDWEGRLTRLVHKDIPYCP
ncbi:MAG: hypothetical protein FJ271_08360 [Planctomycetes bacterium]|nr:hypothetical protein [Planctomycetota bacterium]